MRDLYTRNYRIQHSAGHAETPHEEEMIGVEAKNSESAALLDDEIAEKAVSDEASPEILRNVAESDTGEDGSGEEKASIPHKLRAVKHYRVRSPSEHKPSPEKTEASESDIPAVCLESEGKGREAFEPKLDKDPCSEPAPSHHFVGRQERSFEKKPFGFGQNPFGIKNFTPEDIFLAAILLLLLNEGCEDIMTLILGFLLIS